MTDYRQIIAQAINRIEFLRFEIREECRNTSVIIIKHALFTTYSVHIIFAQISFFSKTITRSFSVIL